MLQSVSEPGWLNVHGVQLEVVERGEGRPILLLHGEEGLDPKSSFLDLLAAHGRVMAPSHPGFAHSPDAETIDTIDDLAYLYLDLLTERDLHEVTLIGFSLGGWIAAEMAVKSTDRLAKLILVAPAGIKVGDRETRDIPDIFALHPDEVTRLQYHDPARFAVDYAKRSDDELTVIARNREATALYAWEPYFHNPSCRSGCTASPCPRSSCGAWRIDSSARRITGPPIARPFREPGSSSSTAPDTSPISNSRRPSSSSSGCSGATAGRRRASHAWLVLQRERVSPAARCQGVRLHPGEAAQPLLRPEDRRRSLSPLHRRVEDRRGDGARDHGERAPSDGDQPESGRPHHHGRARARDAEG